MRTSIIALALSLSALSAGAQANLEDIINTPEKAGGVYYAYPVTESVKVEVPKGYKPFYISHYGRHGSRYLISDNDYSDVLASFRAADKAGALTPLGKDVMVRLDSVWQEGRGRGGELSPLGNRQHRAIAKRMYSAYPEVFADGAVMTARSTPVMRCAHSMFAFIESLKEENPKLVIPRESGQRDMYYLNYHSPESGKYSGQNGPWYQEYRKFKAEKTQPERLVSSLFADSLYVRRNIDPANLMWQLYWVAVDMQNMETPVTFFDIFTPEELFNLWQVFNYNFYACNASYPLANGTHVANASNLLNNIIDTADGYITDNRHGATLRFGHDGNVIPLAALIGVPNADAEEADPGKLHEVYSDFSISPMASNFQFVFFRNPKGDILVLPMLNERPIALNVPNHRGPLYPWPALRTYLQSRIAHYASLQK